MDPNLRPQVSRPPSTSMPPQGPTPLSNLHQYQMQPHFTVGQPHTLPPLQHHQSHSPAPHSYLNQPYRHDIHRYPPTTAHDVYTASSAPMAPHTSVHSLPPSSFLSQHHSQQQFQSHLPSSTSQAYPQPIAPAPPRDRRADYGPIPPGAFSHAENKGPVWETAHGVPGNPAAFVPKDPPRTQVVGSQGRRGILPSVPGRPAAVGNGVNGTTKTTITPQKDADGKFPCPHCNKTYLHAKHLKRHLLRHTGDRPYMCVLCKDTFSRSDILKRHFQKCSLRRGNPTGISHLSHPHAHLKKAQAAGIVPKTHPGDVSSSVPTSNGFVGTSFGESPVNGVAMASGHQPRFTEHQPLSYQVQPHNGMGRGHADHSYAQSQAHQKAQWMAEPKQNSYLVQSGTDSNGQLNVDLPPIDSTKGPGGPDAKRPVIPAGPTPNQAGEIDWTAMFPTGAHDGYMNPVFQSSVAPVADSMHAQVEAADRKFYPTTSGQQQQQQQQQQEGGLNGLYLASTSLGGDGTLDSYAIWNFDLSQNDPLQTKTDRLIDFCFSIGSQEPLNQLPDNDAQLKECLTADNVRHFLDLFAHYQGHWPYLHIPTFNFLDAYDGLILALCCIGAVYSDRVAPSLVRDLVSRTKAAIRRTSRIDQILRNEQDSDVPQSGNNNTEPLSSTDIEEIQAILMLNKLCAWHGGPEDRAIAREEVALFARFARRFNLLKPAGPDDPNSYSILHNLPSNQPVDISNWNWLSWVEQEKRCRLVFMLYLADSAQRMYFNAEPHFDPLEIQIPLPCDDAAWDARDAQQCADALGLRGPELQATVNINGSRCMKQMEMHNALSALQSEEVEFQPSTTNVYSKFILIHAIHVQIWLLQKQLSLGNIVPSRSPIPTSDPASTSYNPLSRSDSPSADGSETNSHPSSGHATPTVSSPSLDAASSVTSNTRAVSPIMSQANATFVSIMQGLKRWKRVWDEDMALQYPPESTLTRRFGFCRDAVHYFWLAHVFLRANRMNDWRLAPDVRLVTVMNMLRKVRSFAQSDAAKRGESLGSMSDIDDNFAVKDLILDMKLLFRPNDELSDGSMDTPTSDTLAPH
ncbi:hypothetical protein AJ80_01226 [Polytolypa hystricis UAMH7299]|uniref:C2H2-type domain-containing protein n=1 Tax=Polytolypa hystricis (strain UAMH7299) TaxID=1447883 RepID=A0A2B7Z144_POLH7|nr:hypothetical protein AJ80_01226 [Polytolypa hystricis UAMH7299]